MKRERYYRLTTMHWVQPSATIPTISTKKPRNVFVAQINQHHVVIRTSRLNPDPEFCLRCQQHGYCRSYWVLAGIVVQIALENLTKGAVPKSAIRIIVQNYK